MKYVFDGLMSQRTYLSRTGILNPETVPMTQLQKMIKKMREKKMTLLDLRKFAMHISVLMTSVCNWGSESAAGCEHVDQDLDLEGNTFDCEHSNGF